MSSCLTMQRRDLTMLTPKQIEKYKKFYQEGLWTKAMIDELYEKGKITAEERDEILGED